jgi:hypothetical protein
VGISVRLWTAEEARDLHEVGIPPVIHFSTASPVHSYAAIDQHVYPIHPHAYTQDASLAKPGAGLIGACSHAGPGSYPAVDPPASVAVTVAVRPHQVDHALALMTGKSASASGYVRPEADGRGGIEAVPPRLLPILLPSR